MSSWNHTIDYVTALNSMANERVMYLEYARMLTWLKHNLERGVDYDWSIPVTVFLGNKGIKLENIPLYLYFNNVNDRLVFKIIFGV